MADIAHLKLKWQPILGLLPSLNTALVATVTAAVSIGGTLATQKLTVSKPEAALMIPAADRPAPSALEKQITAAVQGLGNQLDELKGVAGLCVDEVQALRKDWKSPRAPLKSKAASTK